MTKRVTLEDDAYEALVAVKRPGESFSELVCRAVKDLRRNPFFDRSLKSPLTDDEAEEMKRKVRTWRDETAEPRYPWPDDG
ncbi:MAG: antitoxin VapB family protein [Candidatus Thermoplasmatota archaeon]